MKKEFSLLSRITLAMWVMTTVGTLVAAVLIGNLLIRSHRESIQGQLQAAATSLITLGISDFSELNDFQQLDRFIEDALQMEKVDKIVRVYNRSGKLVFTTVKLGYDNLPSKLDDKSQKPYFLPLEGSTRKYESLVVPYKESGRIKFYFQIAIPLPKYHEMLDALWWQAFLILGLLIGVSLVLSRQLSARLLKPVTMIADHLKKIDPEKMDEWQPIPTDEKGHYLKAIIDGINLLVSNTRAAVKQLRKMSRYVAHEMRTPLTILQGEAETVLQNSAGSRDDYARVLKSSLDEIQRMSETVTTVLTLAKHERRFERIPLQPMNLRAWLADQKVLWEKTLGRPVRLEVSPTSVRAEVSIAPNLLFQLVDNFIRNIRDHTPPETSCTLSLESSDREIRMVVADNGPGLSPSLLRSLNRQDTISEEVGIGLNLCQKIAETCQLGLYYSQPDQGTGLVVKIILQSTGHPVSTPPVLGAKTASHQSSHQALF
ncbi:MAG: HAMP domain-containing histidine kinase [Deltaproteobacteria bacterium]|nr:HAMP domain-containing histidine kinase [Deltaproteobacteria bacterium]MBI4374366.1 HAMP domain-containing histidine kinase [Deltaproteobacteria bacterium]